MNKKISITKNIQKKNNYRGVVFKFGKYSKTFNAKYDPVAEQLIEQVKADPRYIAYGIDFEFPSIDQINAVIADAKAGKSGTYTPRGGRKDMEKKLQTTQGVKQKAGLLVETFGNLLSFRAVVKHAIREHGTDKIAAIFNEGLELVDEAIKDEQAIAKAKEAKYMKAAELIVQARKSGLSEEDFPTPNKAIAALVAKLMREEDEAKKSELYVLEGEKWNGQGNMPCSFKKWLREDENRVITQLKVA